MRQRRPYGRGLHPLSSRYHVLKARHTPMAVAPSRLSPPLEHLATSAEEGENGVVQGIQALPVLTPRQLGAMPTKVRAIPDQITGGQHGTRCCMPL